MNRRPGLPGLSLTAGILLTAAPVIFPAPAVLGSESWQVAGIASAMALLWMTGALPLAATALIPLALLPLLGVRPLSEVAAAYAHPLIILFLGGFMIARAVETSGLHRRIALSILSRFGGSAGGTVAGMMAATAFLSFWISNTATAMIMAPIGASIAASRPGDENLAVSLMLGIAFSATIGGMGSLIGTPPNALFAAYMAEAHGVRIGFAEWALVGLPAVIVLLPICWLLLARGFFPPAREPLELPGGILEGTGKAERRVAVVAVLTAAAWVARPLISAAFPALEVSDAGIAILAALALFCLPDGAGGRLLDWDRAKAIRWDVLILFGGGLALADAISVSGLAASIADAARVLNGWPVPLSAAAFAVLIVLLGELSSNTAMAAIFLPVAGAAAVGLDADPVIFTLPVALAASVGFMLPVATPPNAIVFTHPAVTRARMLRAGAPLDLIATLVALGTAALMAPLVLGSG